MSAQEYAEMAKQVLFIHGGDEGAYAQDSGLNDPPMDAPGFNALLPAGPFLPQ